MMTTKRLRPWRRLAEVSQAILVIGLPFLTIRGESALRFDVRSLQLHFFGISLWMEEFFIVLVATIFFSLFFILITVVFGRIWCGWLCPQTVIADFTSFVDKAKGRGLFYKLSAYSVTLMVSIMVAANLIWYFVSPYEFFPRLFEGSLGNILWGFWIVLTGIMFLNFMLLRQKFCATVCPYSKLQSTLFDDKTLIVAFDQRRNDECIDCMACVKNCPVGIDIRNGLNIACIHCAECIDRCADVMKPRQKTSLISYFFGLPGEGGKALRQNAVLFGAVTIAFLVFFIILLSIRTPLDMTILPNYSFQPKISRKGTVINSYIISVKNRGRTDLKLKMWVKGIEGTIKIFPDRVLRVKAGEMKKFPIYISVEGHGKKEITQEIDIMSESLKKDTIKITKKATFIIPEN
jgi:cytochrome c oxidase accessory protein FixG